MVETDVLPSLDPSNRKTKFCRKCRHRLYYANIRGCIHTRVVKTDVLQFFNGFWPHSTQAGAIVCLPYCYCHMHIFAFILGCVFSQIVCNPIPSFNVKYCSLPSTNYIIWVAHEVPWANIQIYSKHFFRFILVSYKTNQHPTSLPNTFWTVLKILC